MSRIIKFLWVIIPLFSISNSEVRFCYKGPHQVTKAECPYGIYFKERIKVSCIVQTKEAGSSGSIKYGMDVCENGQTVDVPEETPETKGIFIQKITFDEYQAPTALRELNLENATCLDECFPESEFIVNCELEDPIPEHIDDYPPRTPEVDQAQADISARLFPHMTSGSSSQRPGSKLRIFELLEHSSKVAEKYCGEPWISDFFWKQVLEYLNWLILNTSKYKPKDMGTRDYENIKEILSHCRNSNLLFKKRGPECGSKKARIRTITVRDHARKEKITTYRVFPKSFRWGKFDPFIEAAWSILDFTHSMCYKYFADHLNLYHLYEQHLESLFTEVVTQRWIYPPVLKRGDAYWNTLANVYDLKSVMLNLQFCSEAAVNYSPFSRRLDRPFASPSVDDEDNIKGWSHGAAAYMHEYRQLGGFSSIVRSFGHCATNEAQAARLQKELQEAQC